MTHRTFIIHAFTKAPIILLSLNLKVLYTLLQSKVRLNTVLYSNYTISYNLLKKRYTYFTTTVYVKFYCYNLLQLIYLLSMQP
jgi:hypothetical protein